MRARDVLAGNLKLLMGRREDLNTLPKITAASGVSNGALDRMRRAVVDSRVIHVQQIADAFGVDAWRLLAPNLGETLQELSAEEADLLVTLRQRAKDRASTQRSLGESNTSSAPHTPPPRKAA